MRTAFDFSAFTIILTFLVQAASAQDVPRYRPQRPTISPYLNLLRADNGPLPNYYSLVRPQLNQQSFDNQMLLRSQEQAKSVRKLADFADSSVAGPTGSASTFGNLSPFQNRSHFYRAKSGTFRKR
jgi:hypothetical protein